MGPDHRYWDRLRRQLWQPPRPHGQQPRHRVVDPLELFHDLVVVVPVAHHLVLWHHRYQESAYSEPT